jgi:malonyl-CoA/methylmalonyl-CoA synthetase
MRQDMFSRFQARAGDAPDAPFLILPDGAVLTYAAAVARSGQIAGLFRARGVQPGDRIAVQVEKSATALLTYLAALRIGAVYLPLNTGYTAGELRFFLSDAQPALLIHRPEDEAAMADLCAEIGVPARLMLDAQGGGELSDLADQQAADSPIHGVQDDDLAAILYTSGTTGRSKGAMLSQGNLASNAETLREYWRYTADDRLLHALPIFHTHGLFVATNITIAAGAAIILLPKFDVKELVRLMPQANVLMGVPTFYSRLLGEPGFTRDLAAHMRLFVSGSAPLSAEVHKEFSALTGHAILERYGMTETNMNTSNPYDGDRVPGSVGFPCRAWSCASPIPKRAGCCLRARSAGSRCAGPMSSRAIGACPKNGGGTARRRLLHHRRSGCGGCARLCLDRGPGQGSDHLRRLQRLSRRGRGADRRHPRRGGKRGHRHPHPDMGEGVVAVVNRAAPIWTRRK